MIIGRVVYGFQYGLGVRGSWVSMFDVFWVLFGLLFSVGVFGLMFPLCVCVCVCVCVRARARGLVHLVFLQERKKNILTNVIHVEEMSKVLSTVQNVLSFSNTIRPPSRKCLYLSLARLVLNFLLIL